MCADRRVGCVLMGWTVCFQPLRNCFLQRCLSGAHLKYSCEWCEDGSKIKAGDSSEV